MFDPNLALNVGFRVLGIQAKKTACPMKQHSFVSLSLWGSLRDMHTYIAKSTEKILSMLRRIRAFSSSLGKLDYHMKNQSLVATKNVRLAYTVRINITQTQVYFYFYSKSNIFIFVQQHKRFHICRLDYILHSFIFW
jgi:hypothetical protein